MDRTYKHVPYMRLLKACVIGIFVAAAGLCVYTVPAVIQSRSNANAAAIRQENLTASRGEAYDSFDMADVALTVLLDGKPGGGMSVAADRGFWVVPQDGTVALALAPNTYRFSAGFENRKLVFTGEVFAGQRNEFVLDVDKAPSAPEVQMWEIPAGESAIVSMEIANADAVTAPNLPQGISIAKQNGAFVLLIDKSGLSPGFYCFPLTAENQYGQASSYACLRIPSGRAVTPIYTAAQLSAIRDDLSGHYLLMNDIDMSGLDDWVPIGTDSYPFAGIFDGGGHEITGFHAPGRISEGVLFALFGAAKNAELRNVIFRDPMITPDVPARELGTDFRCSVLCTTAIECLIENCGSFGGIVSPSDGWAGGLMNGAVYSIVLDCFNSTDVICNMANRYLPNTGGVMGSAHISYVARCANEGEVKGNHLSGGIAGYATHTDIARCINSGYIWGSTIVGAIPAGGIVQSNDYGAARYSYFVRGLAASGAFCIDGLVVSVVPITEQELCAPDRLPFLGSFDGKAPAWAYASLDARGPVPCGILKEQTPAPTVSQADGRIVVSPVEGVLYFYTVDGGAPYSARQLNLTLKSGQTLRICAAKQGLRDSEILTITAGNV